jgi:hypothetical protein
VTEPDRLVFELSDAVTTDGVKIVEIALKEPKIWATKSRPFSYRGDEPAFLGLTRVPMEAGTVQTVGQLLYSAVALHPELKQTLAEALRKQPPERYPVLVEIDTDSPVEGLPWETLCDRDGTFLALDERWGVARIVDGALSSPAQGLFTPPLKLAVVLSCLGVPAADEWKALWDSLAAFPGLPVEVLALVSEDSLDIQLVRSALPGVTVDSVPRDARQLKERISCFDPHVLHFFCHGSTEGSPHLSVAVRSDWRTGSSEGSLFLEAAQIRDLTPRTADRPWLVVLNCCESAAKEARDSLQSLALMVVRDAGVPAVIGMREPVASSVASLVTENFYRALLAELAGRLDGTVEPVEPFDWARLVVRVREKLCDKYQMPRTVAARNTRDWTLPVVYVRPPAFTVLPTPSPATGMPPPETEPAADTRSEPTPEPVPTPSPPPDAAPGTAPTTAEDPIIRAMRLEADLLRGLLTQLPPETPAELIADVRARFNDLIAQLGGTVDADTIQPPDSGGLPSDPGSAAPASPEGSP